MDELTCFFDESHEKKYNPCPLAGVHIVDEVDKTVNIHQTRKIKLI
jgi:hypothetical protein